MARERSGVVSAEMDPQAILFCNHPQVELQEVESTMTQQTSFGTAGDDFFNTSAGC